MMIEKEIAHGCARTVNDLWKGVFYAVLTIAQIERKINEHRENLIKRSHPV